MEQTQTKRQVFKKWFFFSFGVVFPLGTILFELLTGASADMLFDPIPTWGHVALAAMVPASNLWLFLMIQRDKVRWPRLAGVVNGVAILVSFYYALLYLPVLPIAVLVAVFIFIGVGILGLMAWTPLLCFVSTIRYRLLLRAALGQGESLRGLWPGLALGVLLLLATSLPQFVAHFGMGMAASEEPTMSARGLRLLRTFGSEEVMGRMCNGNVRRPMDLASWVTTADGVLSQDQARDLYFRVTGRDCLKAEQSGAGAFTRRNVWLNNVDMGVGGEEVAGMVDGLAMVESRMDGSADPDGALAYLEWTMVFRNNTTGNQEARAQVQLPPGAVVSRLTLWINGEEREAAFGGRSQTREAYESVVQRNRDPVLVTTAGPDRILVQCFPVLPNGQRMKVRVGMTVPLILDKAEEGVLLPPRILERNFALGKKLRHHVYVASKGKLTTNMEGLSTRRGKGEFLVFGQLVDAALQRPGNGIGVARNPVVQEVVAVDNRSTPPALVRQEIETVRVAKPTTVVAVVDGSAVMAQYEEEVAQGLAALATSTRLKVLVASDAVEWLASKPDAGFMGDALEEVGFVGGQDNGAALREAFSVVGKAEPGAVVWIHGPSEYLPGNAEGVLQFLERGAGVPFYSIQAGHGPNRLLETMETHGVTVVPRREELAADLKSLARFLTRGGEIYQARRSAKPIDSNSNTVAAGSEHLVRLWANDMVMADLRSGRPVRREAAVRRAVDYRLVTPVSGAVVLETVAQYKAAGLSPVKAGEVPTVPEPHEWVLIILSLLMILYTVWKRRKGVVFGG